MPLVEEFSEAFGVWDIAQPYIHLMFDEEEMQLVVNMKGQAVTAEQAAALQGTTPEQAAALLERCFRRGIVDKVTVDGITSYRATDFYTRLDFFAKFENWNDIPPASRQAIDRRYLDEFIARNRGKIEQLKRGEPVTGHLPNADIMLLREAEEMIEAADEIVVQPCDCRLLHQGCRRPVETCIAFNEYAAMVLARGHGRRLSKEEGLKLIRWADKRGLMHTSSIEWKEKGLVALCNCCACDCYPFRAGQELGTKGLWPKVRFVAVHDRERCTLCGTCVKRCHFAAFYHDGTTVELDGKVKQNVRFAAERCWGCGLCANTCPAQAISMESVAETCQRL